MKVFNKEALNKKFKVLYVEDQADIRDEFQELLSLYVDEVVTADNGEDGLKKYYDFLPDIIVTDIQMPIMNGLKMIEAIRENDSETPIIVTSAFNDNKYLLEAIGLGVEHYILKPVMLKVLEEKLTKIKSYVMQKRELDAYQLYLEDRVEEEIAAREAKESLLISQNRDAEIGQMVSVIAHQWKQPLHYLYFLIDDLGFEFSQNNLNQKSIDQFIEKGIQKVEFLTQTMDSFLRFYKTTTKINTFMVEHLVNDIVFFLLDPFQSMGVDLYVEIEKDFALKGIENELQQIILNLVNNAKEAFDGQKKLDAKVVIRVAQEGQEGLLEVSDNAGGIPEDIIDKICDMEYTTKEKGNGIGLYLVKKIVTQRFNGTLDVSNTVEGACFSMRFKISSEKINES